MKSFLMLLFVGATLACDNFPNGTQTAFHWFECGTGSPIVTDSVAVVNEDGSTDYPIDLKKPIYLAVSQENKGSTTYNKVLLDAKIAMYGGILGCSWHTVPDFGLLSNIDGCKMSGNCPFKPGKTSFKTQLDLSAYGPIIQLLDDGKAYQLMFTFKNGDDSAHEKLDCLAAQFQIKK